MKSSKILFFLATINATSSLFAQQTIGLFTNTTDAYDGYTLFAPMTNSTTYLIDNCGEKVHSWNSDYNPVFRLTFSKTEHYCVLETLIIQRSLLVGQVEE
ncbi:MAG: hypothetical protein GY816_16590 [Cytophagales bacterium]|nr:hypothetical protein [Cytophagales bacterium]